MDGIEVDKLICDAGNRRCCIKDTERWGLGTGVVILGGWFVGAGSSGKILLALRLCKK